MENVNEARVVHLSVQELTGVSLISLCLDMRNIKLRVRCVIRLHESLERHQKFSKRQFGSGYFFWTLSPEKMLLELSAQTFTTMKFRFASCIVPQHPGRQPQLLLLKL